MLYTYFYKSGDGQRHEATMTAASREAVFESLRARGIRAIKVVAADGSKANGDVVVRGVRKRVVALAVLAVAVLVGGAAFWLGRGAPAASPASSAPGGDLREARPLARQAIDGYRARLENPPADLFRHKAERFLARFAEPGRAFSAPEADWPTKAECEAALADPVLVSDREFSEYVDLKRIVVGMKREMAEYLRAGGYASGYVRELIKRQRTEISYRDRADVELTRRMGSLNVRTQSPEGDRAARDRAGREAYDYWLRANAQLQSMGIAPIRLPDLLRRYQTSVFD